MKPLLLTLLLLLDPNSGPTVTVSPTVGFEPLFIRATVHIPPTEGQREACLVWLSDEGQNGSSCWPLSPNSPPTMMKEIKSLTAGDYEFQAYLYVAGSNQPILSARRPVQVTPRSH